MRPMTPRRLVNAAVVLAALAGSAYIVRPYAHGLSLVIRAAELGGALRTIADYDTTRVRSRELQIPLAAGTLRARAYEPAGTVRRTALLVSGLHPAGIDEPRLMRLSRELAASGLAVVTPDIAELPHFAVTAATTDTIEQAASWLASQPSFSPDGRIAMMGISFSGGLSIVAAGRPALRDRVAFVFSFGGHGDLPRVLKYLCTGIEPPPPDSASALSGLRLRREPSAGNGGARPARRDSGIAAAPPPHDYGVAIILLGVAERLVPASQAGPLKTAVLRYLQASAWDRDEKEKAAREFESLRALARTMPEPSATLLRYMNDRDVAHLGARLLPHLGAFGGSPALSAEKSPAPSAPVFLLHGLEDNVIPAAESVHLAAALRRATHVRVLLSSLISHADADQPPRVGDVMQAASFWGDLLAR
jgi:dienelactone hydrolase